MTTGAAQYWQVCDDHSFTIKVWDDGTVIYDDVSGDTHFLDAFSAEIVSQLLQGKQSIAGLRDVMAAQVEDLDDETLCESIRVALTQLNQSGLAHLVAPSN